MKGDEGWKSPLQALKPNTGVLGDKMKGEGYILHIQFQKIGNSAETEAYIFEQGINVMLYLYLCYMCDEKTE